MLRIAIATGIRWLARDTPQEWRPRFTPVIVAVFVAFAAQPVRGQERDARRRAEGSVGFAVGAARDDHGLSGALGEASLGFGATGSRARVGVSGTVFRAMAVGPGNCSSLVGEGSPVLTEESCNATGASLLSEGNVSLNPSLSGPVFYLGGRLGLMRFRNRDGLAWDVHAGTTIGRRRAVRIELGHKEFGKAGFRSTVVAMALTRSI